MVHHVRHGVYRLREGPSTARGFTRTASATIFADRDDHAWRTQSRSPTFFSTAFFSAGINWFGPRLTVSFSSFPVKSNGHA